MLELDEGVKRVLVREHQERLALDARRPHRVDQARRPHRQQRGAELLRRVALGARRALGAAGL
jgi:hypothetical protein